MSLKRLRKKAKKYGRKVLAVGAKVSRVARPVVAAAAGYFGGPVAAAAVTAASHYGQQYQAAAGARGKGIRGREAREIGRKEAQRTTKYSLAAGTLGVVGSGVTSALAGGSFFGGAAAGQGGAALLGGNTIFGSAAAGSLTNAVSGGTASLAGVQSGWDSLYKMNAPTGPAGAMNDDIPSGTDWAAIAAGVAAGAAGALDGGPDEDDGWDTSGNKKPGDDSDSQLGDLLRRFGITDSPSDGGDKPAWLVPALVGVGALVFFS